MAARGNRTVSSTRRAKGTDCNYFKQVLSSKFKRVEANGNGDPFDKDVPARDEYGRKHIRTRSITKDSFESAANSMFALHKDGTVRSLFDHRITQRHDKLSDDDKKVILHQIMHFAVGGKNRTPYRGHAWHATDADVALKVITLIARARVGNSPLNKACRKHLKDNADDWDISTHPESAPVNGPSGKAKDGIHKLDAYSKTK